MAKKRGRSGPNLTYQGDYIINQYGVKISLEEARQLRNAVKVVNRKARNLEDQFKDMPLMLGKGKSPESKDQLRLMGKQMDISIRERSASMQQFTSRGQFTAYLKGTQRAAKFDYLDYRGKQYKKNLITAIKKEYASFPDLVKGVTMKIQMMPQDKFLKMMATNQLFEISYQYQIGKKLDRLMQMRDYFNLKSPYDDHIT